MKIAHNVSALQATTAISRADKKVSTSSMRISTGVRINSAKDDAAGLAVSRKLKVQIAGLEKASQNATDGISLLQTSDGALTEVTNMLQRMRELAVQSANGPLEAEDREKIQAEIDALVEEVSAIADRTEFNKIKTLNGQASRLGFSDYGNLTQAAAAQISKVSYISDTVDAGKLNYKIESVGLPAQVKGTPDLRGSTPLGYSGTIILNGERIAIGPNDTADEIFQKLQFTGNAAGANVTRTAGGQVIMTTRDAGSNQYLTLGEDTPGLLASIFGGVVTNGVSNVAGTVAGTDAVIKNVSFTDKGSLTANTNFDATKTVICYGNRVEITAANGQKISLDIQLLTDAVGNFSLRSGQVVDSNGNILTDPDGTSLEDPPTSGSYKGMEMTAEIKDYGPLVLQIGPNYQMEMSIIIPTITAESLGLTNLNYQTQDTASRALEKVDRALSDVNSVRAKLGAYQNRLEYTVLSLDASAEATETSRSRIEDTNMAKETTNYTLQSVIVQAGLSILAQCNQRPQQVLSVLG